MHLLLASCAFAQVEKKNRQTDIILNVFVKSSQSRRRTARPFAVAAARVSEFKRYGERKPASCQRGVARSPLCLWVAGEQRTLSPATIFLIGPLLLPFTALPLQVLMSPVTLTVLIFIKLFLSPRCPVCDTGLCVK